MKRSMRAERRAVDHHRAVRLVVGADVVEVEALGELVVDLHGAELPLAADDVLDDEVDLRPVERGFAGLLGERHAERFGGVAAGVLGAVPLLAARRRICRCRGRAGRRARGSRSCRACSRTIFTSSRQPCTSAGDLFLGAEEVRVVLGEAADAGHAAELAGFFPAIDGAELGEAHGQVAVAALLAGEDLDVHAGSSSA